MKKHAFELKTGDEFSLEDGEGGSMLVRALAIKECFGGIEIEYERIDGGVAFLASHAEVELS